ncbi:hypothetical protein HQ604_01945 [Rhodococcus corynebacterioides]|uniref:Uncharacterized protein n=1 Tax=Rhodococcoides corynebacterioides TaxID=53972 RepID=A0ABS7NYN4_9NOCA|nr:hypothetical protein [Rhodococcus corynebacterioides]MBY6406661.1 hypothetical protein [Rhodococcus corynebacterioides]
MSPKRGDRVAPPAAAGAWELRFASNDAVKGWEELCRQAASNTAAAWREMRDRGHTPTPTARHHRLKGSLASASHSGVSMEQWQIEVTGAGRVWYLVDVDHRTLWVKLARTGHPKATE